VQTELEAYGGVTHFDISPDRTRIITYRLTPPDPGGVRDQTILWNLTTGQKIREFKDPLMVSHRLVFSPDGRYVIASGGQRTFRFWELKTGEIAREVKFTRRGANTELNLSHDGRMLLSPGQLDFLYTDLKTGRTSRFPRRDFEWIRSAAFSPREPIAVVGRYNRDTKASFIDVWDFQKRRRIKTLPVPKHAYQNLRNRAAISYRFPRRWR